MKNNLQITLDDCFVFEMVPVEGGEFMMGSDDYGDEKPIHRVSLSNFYMGKYPVTQALWQTVMVNNPSRFSGPDRPVERISWNDVQDFFKRLNRATGKQFRLPTEAEWEYAARGGRKSNKYEYAGSNRLDEVGWYSENSYGEPKPAGLKFANELGLFDMSGNVWEWCQDWYDKDYYEKCAETGVVDDPQGPLQGTYRVFRGGGYSLHAVLCSVVSRNNFRPDDSRGDSSGFRLVLG